MALCGEGKGRKRWKCEREKQLSLAAKTLEYTRLSLCGALKKILQKAFIVCFSA
jgi:hypothetical protein